MLQKDVVSDNGLAAARPQESGDRASPHISQRKSNSNSR